MAINLINTDLQYFPQFSASKAISGAQIYVGLPDTDPTVLANQIQVYAVQEDGTTVSITQPVQTGAGGVPTYNGSPVQIACVEDTVSMKVLSSIGSQIYYKPSISQFVSAANATVNVQDYAAIRTYTGAASSLQVTGLLATAQPQGIAGTFALDTTDTTSGAVFNGSIAPISLTPPTPTLSSSAGGSLGATTYYVKITYANAGGESLPSAEASLAVAANNVLVVASPAAVAGATGYNVYVNTISGQELLQNTSPMVFGTNWTEPTSGLNGVKSLPTANTMGSVLTVNSVSSGTLSNWMTANRGDTGATVGIITGQLTGTTGGVGTYSINTSFTLPTTLMTSDDGATYIVDASGRRWKRNLPGNYSLIEWFGGAGDYTNSPTSATDNGPLFYVWQFSKIAPPLLQLRKGKYYSSLTWNVKNTLNICGEAGSAYLNDVSGSYPSQIYFADNIPGIIVHRYNTNASLLGVPYIESSPTGGGDGATFENFKMTTVSGTTTCDNLSHGIFSKSRFTGKNVYALGFNGNSFHIFANSGSSDPYQQGNANGWLLENCSAAYGYHGLFIQGSDANAGKSVLFNAAQCVGYGILDESFLGNVHDTPEVATCKMGGYRSVGLNQSSAFIAPYTEGGVPSNHFEGALNQVFVSPGQNIKGIDFSSTIAKYTTRPLFELLTQRKPGSLAYYSAGGGGTGYTTATVTFPAPNGTSAVLGTPVINMGKIISIPVTSAGAGYSTTPNVTINGDGTGAVAKVVMSSSGTVQSIAIVSTGAGYTTATVTIDAPTLTQATATVVVNSNGSLGALNITNKGAGYSGTTVTGTVSGDGTGASDYTVQLGASTNSQGLWSLSFGNAYDLTYGDELLKFAHAGNTALRLTMDSNSLDSYLGYNNAGNQVVFGWTSPKTSQKFGRIDPVANAPFFPVGVFLGSGSAGRCVINSSSMPTSGKWAIGDFVINTVPSVQGTAGSQYIILGWSRITQSNSGGTNNTLNTDWVQCRTLTGT